MFNSTNIVQNSDIFKKIAKLEEQVKQLQLENDDLKQQLATQPGYHSHNVSHIKAQEIRDVKITSCGCKGDCSTRRCSCTKENSKCTASCKCKSEMCKNQVFFVLLYILFYCLK